MVTVVTGYCAMFDETFGSKSVHNNLSINLQYHLISNLPPHNLLHNLFSCGNVDFISIPDAAFRVPTLNIFFVVIVIRMHEADLKIR
jgi:hypothetical protein